MISKGTSSLFIPQGLGKQTDPFVTVLMSVYNAEKFVREAVESILNQTYVNFEFLIIDDGSTDNSLQILKTFEDRRIRIIENGSNLGLIESLNRGLKQAGGTYIARMDADDVSLPHRLERQVAFMEDNPDVGASSAWMKSTIDGTVHLWKTHAQHDQILASMFSNSSMWHPVSIMRKNVLEENGIRYEKEYYRSEDYRLWIRLSEVSLLANIPEVLHEYRIHKYQESKQLNSSQKIREQLLVHFLDRPLDSNEKNIHANLHFSVPYSSRQTMNEVRNWIEYLVKWNRMVGKYKEPEFSNSLESAFRASARKSFYHLIRHKKRFTPDVIFYLYLSGRHYYRYFSVSNLIRFSVKALIFWPNKRYVEQESGSLSDGGQ